VQLNIREIKDPIRPLYNFIELVSLIMPYFTKLWHDKLMEKEDNNSKIPSFFYITKCFYDSIKMSQNTKIKLRIANAIIEQSN
jgi:hypothetical protein